MSIPSSFTSELAYGAALVFSICSRGGTTTLTNLLATVLNTLTSSSPNGGRNAIKSDWCRGVP